MQTKCFKPLRWQLFLVKILVMTTTSFLSPTQRYAAGALFAIALHQAQNNQTRPLGLPSEDDSNMERSSSSSSSDSVAEDPELWVHENSGLLRPVFRWFQSFSVSANSFWNQTENGIEQSTHPILLFCIMYVVLHWLSCRTVVCLPRDLILTTHIVLIDWLLVNNRTYRKLL